MNAMPSQNTPSLPNLNDQILLKLAREVAMDIHPIGHICKAYNVSSEEWTSIQVHPTFQRYLARFVEEWQSAANTQERVKFKALSMVEESLPEFYARMHDRDESLNAKNEVLKTVAKFAGIGGADGVAVSGEKLSITINLGDDKQVRIERDVTPPTVEGFLDGEDDEAGENDFAGDDWA